MRMECSDDDVDDAMPNRLKCQDEIGKEEDKVPALIKAESCCCCCCCSVKDEAPEVFDIAAKSTAAGNILVANTFETEHALSNEFCSRLARSAVQMTEGEREIEREIEREKERERKRLERRQNPDVKGARPQRKFTKVSGNKSNDLVCFPAIFLFGTSDLV
jgi:hypothetical protein